VLTGAFWCLWSAYCPNIVQTGLWVATAPESAVRFRPGALSWWTDRGWAARRGRADDSSSELSRVFRFRWRHRLLGRRQHHPGDTTIREVKQGPHRTVTRRWDEPRLEIGATIPIEEGLVGVALARYTRSGDARNDVHYIVELRREAEEH
jgi:hypothetical protein